jgi:hypothetical protein
VGGGDEVGDGRVLQRRVQMCGGDKVGGGWWVSCQVRKLRHALAASKEYVVV